MKHPVAKLPDCQSAFYVFEPAAAIARVDWLRARLPQHVSICYAVKANPFLCDALSGAVERFEVCSPGEARICLAHHISQEKLVISGVYKTPAFIEEMVCSGAPVLYTVESMTQFTLLQKLAQQYQRKLSLLLRLTNGSQFGINAADIEQIVANRAQFPLLTFRGIQYFSGTQKNSLKKYARELRMLDNFLQKLHDSYGYTAPELEYGTGFPVAYFLDESVDEDTLLQGFSELLTQMSQKPHITLELGRSIAACCGQYYTHVVDFKNNDGQNYVLVDGGMHHLVYFGQHMAMRHPKLHLVGKENHPVKDVWNICGSLCSMNDILAKQLPLPSLQIGDLLCFENTGAYCMTEGTALFLSREIPAVYFLENENYVCVRSPIETARFNTPLTERN